jgi:hypothetical protein
VISAQTVTESLLKETNQPNNQPTNQPRGETKGITPFAFKVQATNINAKAQD